MTSGRHPKAKQGQRLAEALGAIANFETKKVDWGFMDLARALSCSSSQARNLVATLTLKGHLEPRETMVRVVLPQLTRAGRAAQAA